MSGSRKEPVVGQAQLRSESSRLIERSAPVSDAPSVPDAEPVAANMSAADASSPPITANSGSSHAEDYGHSAPRNRNRRARQNARRGGRHTVGEESRNRWLVSYADFVTLLLGFFVVMYGISSINEEKYQKISKTFAGIFENSNLTMDPIQVGDPVPAVSPDIVPVATDTTRAEQGGEGDSAKRISREYVESALGGLSENGGLNIASNENWLEISLDSAISFESDSVTLKPEAVQILQELAKWLATFDNPVTIEGYTDNVPVNGRRFTSNWQLSSARASAVAENLTAAGIDAKRISAVGYGENHPLATNASPEGRAKNRRVVIVVAHNGALPRNLNTSPETSAFAFVRHSDDQVPEVPQRRTARGGLLFSNE